MAELPPNSLLNVHSFKRVLEQIHAERMMIAPGEAGRLIQVYLDAEKERKTGKSRKFEVWCILTPAGEKMKLQEYKVGGEYTDPRIADDDRLRIEMENQRSGKQVHYKAVTKEFWR